MNDVETYLTGTLSLSLHFCFFSSSSNIILSQMHLPSSHTTAHNGIVHINQ